MKKVLILAFYNLPFPGIASYRTKAYTDYFKSNGISPTVITVDWVENDNGWEIGSGSFNLYDNCEIHRLGVSTTRIGKILDWLLKRRYTSHFAQLIGWIFGHFEVSDTDIHYSYKKFLKEHLATSQYDLILGIYSPHFIIRLTSEIASANRVPFAFDFRDIWDNRELSKGSEISIGRKIQNWFAKIYWKRWSREALFFTTTNKVWKNKLEELLRVGGTVIENGYEVEMQDLRSTGPNDRFTISYIGSIYEGQNINVFLKGFLLFLEDSDHNADILLQFVGVRDLYRAGILKEIQNVVPGENLKMVPRVDKQLSLRLACESDILWYPAFEHYFGWKSAKLYDYLGSHKNVLVAPGDHGGVVDELIRETRVGVIAYTKDEVLDFLRKKYKEWKNEGRCAYFGHKDRVEYYTRKSQSSRMAELINSKLI